MSESPDSPLARENERLRRRLERSLKKMRVLESLQEQTGSTMRVLLADLEAERARSEDLLRNILPGPIADRLKAGETLIAERVDAASVLFADLVGFTALSATLDAGEMVAWLNEVYSAFDAAVVRRGLEKIRTIGDNYMVASGVPTRRGDHAVALAALAVELRDHVARLPPLGGRPIDFRIGIGSGPVVGGVIGTHKFQYDIWGDTVNLASRMESQGLPGRIQVTATTHALIEHAFVCEPRGRLEVKGIGPVETWLLVGPR